MVLPCSTCKGTGEITEERGRWISEGKRLRDYRLGGQGEYLSAREAARRYDVPTRAWVDAEVGCVDPAPLWAAVKRAVKGR